jgi:hypothetical protein
VGIEAEQKGPLEGNETPDTGEVVAGRVHEACQEEESNDSRPPLAKQQAKRPWPPSQHSIPTTSPPYTHTHTHTLSLSLSLSL